MPVVGAPDIERSLGAAHAGLAVVLFVVPGLIALVVEPIIFLYADRYPRQWFIRAGVAAMSVAAFAAACAPGAVTLSLAVGLAYIATGTATSLAQATLVDQAAARAEPERARTLARWTLWSTAGDLVAPGLFALLALADASWRWGFALVGVLLAVWAAALVAAPLDAPRADEPEIDEPDTDAPSLGLLATLRDALTDKVLVAWLFGTALCDLLDEIFVVFASLRVRTELHAGPFWQTATVAGFMVGNVVGLAVLDRLLTRHSERRLLVCAALGCVAAYVPWLLAPSPLAVAVLAIPVGACAAPLYPLSAAQAYARRPEQSGSVLAASHLFTPLGLALPFLVGAVADVVGTTAALGLLAIEPLGLVVLCVLGGMAPRASTRETGGPRTPDST